MSMSSSDYASMQLLGWWEQCWLSQGEWWSDIAVERGDDVYWLSYNYDVVDDSLAAICLPRLCPQFRCHPKVGVLADDSFHREASSLIGRVTFGRCTVAVGYNGAIGCMLAFTLSMLCLIISFFFTHARMALSRMIAFSVAGSKLRSLPLQLLQSSSVNTPSPGA